MRPPPPKYPTSTRQVEKLIEIIGDNSYSVWELIELIDLKNRKNFMNNYLNPAIEAGMVEPLYPEQPRHPRQKYQLTEDGKKVLKALE